MVIRRPRWLPEPIPRTGKGAPTESTCAPTRPTTCCGRAKRATSPASPTRRICHTGYRTNLGLLNTDTTRGAKVKITVLNLDGSLAAEPVEVFVNKEKLIQFDLFSKLGIKNVTMVGSVEIEVLNGTGGFRRLLHRDQQFEPGFDLHPGSASAVRCSCGPRRRVGRFNRKSDGGGRTAPVFHSRKNIGAGGRPGTVVAL